MTYQTPEQSGWMGVLLSYMIGLVICVPISALYLFTTLWLIAQCGGLVYLGLK